ncbi:ChrR family anti-sigma-E factor [Sulfitobacter sp. F26169L]|uniref:ChrR family anti-sigma-E factor n=1 Tax=Sulfitobacter sp. F26169L TaxID=2996015 RepID=UPI002260AB86|nr:ChrR family anti-sigma-E factor [Sulfitobacter sp. F26169L]MCX7565604.1 ChrR family anti-sigma-E factor [Sulfitobacter sp. F26169L]
MTQPDITSPSGTAIRHHLNEATLMGYAAGTLPEAFNLIVATHLSLCDRCRADVQAYDAVGGALLEDESAALADESLAQTLARLDADPKPAGRKKTATGDFPAPLQDYVGGDLDAVRWRPLGMGVKQAILPTSKAATARLFLIPAGAAMPDHGHNGTEMTLVLKGAFLDGNDYFARGDIEIADIDVQHIPIADVHEDCICLAVTDAPLRFTGILPSILQKFFRI